PIEEGEQPVDLEDGLGLGVGAVQLDIGEGPLRLRAPLFEAGRDIGLLAADGEGGNHLLAVLEELGRPLQLPLDAAPAREGPLGYEDRLALGVVQRVLAEPAPDEVDQPAVAKWVPGPGCD